MSIYCTSTSRIATLALLGASLAGAQTSVFTVLGNSSPYTDSTGQVWAASNGCSGGASNSTTNAIVGSGADPTIYQHNLTSTSAFSCTYTVTQNVFYNVTLKFANITNLAINQFIFNVYINNTLVRNNLDIAALTSVTPGVAGTNRASDLGFTIPVGTVGQVSINLVPIVGGAMLNAISIVGQNLPTFTSLQGNPFFVVNNYNFTPQTPGTSLPSGACSFTMSPLPAGVVTGGLLYIQGGVGSAELLSNITVTGSTISGTCANTHSGAWTVQSACSGGQEAITAGGAGAVIIFSSGTYSCHGQITVSAANVRMTGTRGALIQAAANANLTYLIQTTNTATGFTLDNLTLDGNRANNGTQQNPGAAGNAKNLFAVLQIGGAHSTVDNAEIRLAQVNGITVQDPSTPPSDFKLTNSYLHDNGGVINSSGWGIGVFFGNPNTIITGAEISSNRFENNYNTVTAPGPSAAINAFNTNDVQVVGNYAKNNFNVTGGQIVTGSTLSVACTSNDTNWTVTGNTAILTTQFGGDITFGIEVCGSQQTIAGNTLLGNDQGGILTDAGSVDLTITGNYIDGNGNKHTPNTSAGISFGGAVGNPALRMVVSGNNLKNYDWGLSNQFSTNDFLSLRGNLVYNNSTPVVDTSTQSHVFISENAGFNPQIGATGTITVTASPFTFTAGHLPVGISIVGGTVSSVVLSGGPQSFCTTPCFFRLEPNQTTTVTYTVAPTMIQTIQ